MLTDLLHARQRVAVLVGERDQAFAALVESGLPAMQVEPVLRERLAAAGWTEDDIKQVGLSYGTVKRVMDQRRRGGR